MADPVADAPSITGDANLDAILAAQSAEAAQTAPGPEAPAPAALTPDEAAQARVAAAMQADPAPDALPFQTYPGAKGLHDVAGALKPSPGAVDMNPRLTRFMESLGASEPAAPAVPAAAPGAPRLDLPARDLTVNGQTAASFQGPNVGGLVGQLRSAQALEEKGVRGEAAAHAQAATESATALDAYQKQFAEAQRVTQEHQAAARQHFDDLTKEHDAIAQDVANTHIDPQRVWSNKSAGQKAAAVIGMILGGVGSGLTGQPNQALAVIHKQIEQDIDAQKSELGKKENLLADNYRKLEGFLSGERLDQAARQLTASQLTAVLEGQLKLAAARSGSPEAMAKADQIVGASRKGMVQTYASLAQMQAAYSMMANAGAPGGYLPSRAAPPTGSDPTNPLKYVVEARKDASERTLVGPGGKPYLAFDKETAGKARPMLQAAQNAAAIVREMQTLRQKASGMPGTDAANLYHKYRSALSEQWAMANGLTQPSEVSNKNLEAVMPSNWDAFVRGGVTFQPIVKLLHDRTNGIHESAGLHPDALPILQIPVK